ncbi:MAG: hypothetical protein WAS51_15655 [Ilumatobacteraceae bacterium]|nr:MAG: hypothetical protein IPM43_05040 [Actinomycetota bacterium]
MSPLALLAARLPMSEFGIDDDGYVTSHHWLWPERAEIIYGGLASIIIFAALIKFAGPMAKKAMEARSARIQTELDNASADRTAATAEAERIRQALGDIGTERARLLAEADAQAAGLLSEGRSRLAQELIDAEERAAAEIASAAGRAGDELHADISRLAAEATDRVVAETLDESVQHDLVESFIARVGASR